MGDDKGQEVVLANRPFDKNQLSINFLVHMAIKDKVVNSGIVLASQIDHWIGVRLKNIVI